MSHIKKVLNSSVVLVEKDGKEMVVFGKGIGYGKKPGMSIEDNQVDQSFLPVENIQTQQLLDLVDAISPVYFDITQEIVQYAEQYLDSPLNLSIYFTLMDHLNFAVERAEKGINITNRVYWEIKSYYPNEFHIGEYACTLVNKALETNLPEEEAANIAFHLINAQNSDNRNTDGMKYAKMVGSIVNLIRYSLNTTINTESIHYVRFITHVKFFVERFFADKLMEKGDKELFEQIAILYPQAMNSAFKVKEYVEKIYDKDVPNDELTYLAVHINRLLNYNELDG